MRYNQVHTIAKRHGQLLMLIRQGTFSSAGLATEVRASEQTIYRDIEFLRKQGHKIKSVRVSRVWASAS